MRGRLPHEPPMHPHLSYSITFTGGSVQLRFWGEHAMAAALSDIAPAEPHSRHTEPEPCKSQHVPHAVHPAGDDEVGSSQDCPVCLETVAVTRDSWRVFPCTHGTCSGCVADLVR